MSFKPAFLVVGGLVAAISLSGCVGRYQSNFPVVVVNKTVNTIQVLANGSMVGQVAAAQTGSFTLQLPESNQNVFTNGVAPTPQAQVTFTAKDTKTGMLSDEKGVTLSSDTATYVTFSAADFPSTGPTIARFTFSPTNASINSDVSFNASSSTVSNGTFAWDFGDGQTGSGVTVVHQYPRAGTFTITLTVTNDTGVSSTSSRTITVSANLPAIANFTFSPTNPAINQAVVFTATVPGNVIGAIFAWDFGDAASGSGATVTHTFSRSGTFTVSLRITSDTGQSATTTRTVTVSATSNQVVARFTVSPTTPGINDVVFFNASSSTVTNGSYAWDFGDGSRASGVTQTHQYSRAGTFTVTLTLANDFGQTSTASSTVTVSATSNQVVARFTFSPTTPGINDDVFFNASSSTASNPSFRWDFGDGSSGVGVTVSHRYARAGTFTVTLAVTNDIGQTSTTSNTVPVAATSTAIVVDFTFSPTDPGIGKGTNTVIFDATPSTGTVTAWTWDFGDGSDPGSGQRTTHTFTRPGTWVVRLTVTDSAGRTATTTKNVTVAP